MNYTYLIALACSLTLLAIVGLMLRDHGSRMTVAELLAAVTQEERRPNGLHADRGRYVAVERVAYRALESYIDEEGIPQHHYVGDELVKYRLYGGAHIYMYKTLRNALKAAGDGGFVCALDLSWLPIVDVDAVAAGVDDKNEIDEYAFAERQLDAWAVRVRDLKEKQSR